MIRHLERVVPAQPGRPARGGPDHPMRVMTRQLAADPGTWGAGQRRDVTRFFDELAPEWHTRASPLRHEPLADAFSRGGPIPDRLGLEVGSGIGLSTPWLADRFRLLVAIDLSAEMMARAPAQPAPRVLADASALPLPDGVATAVVLVNMFLFADEVDRVLAPEGAVVWVNTSGEHTPIHLPAEEIDAALPGRWDGLAAEAGWGSWAVLRRA